MRSVLVFSLLLAAAPAAFAQTEEEKHQQCLEKIDTDAEAAYQDGLSWLARGNRPAARHCTALALIALGQEAEGAARLEELANAPDGGSLDERGIYLVQSGNAWLMAGMPDAAVVTLTNALKLRPADGELFKDRARAYVTLKKWAEAGKDLDEAIRLSAADAEAYRLRGLALLKTNRLTDAWDDVQVAMRLAPKDINVVVLRGDVREAMRLAGMDDPAGVSDSGEARTRIVGN
jgi:tetratricopeptide (TPR) repeat protein